MKRYEKIQNDFNAIMADNTIPHVVKFARIQNMFLDSAMAAWYEPIPNDRNLKVSPGTYREMELHNQYTKYLEKQHES